MNKAELEGVVANYPFKSSYGSNQYLKKYVADGDYFLALKTYCEANAAAHFFETMRVNGKVIAIRDNNNEWRMFRFQYAYFSETGVASYDKMNYDDSAWFNVPSNCDGFALPFNDDQVLDPLNPYISARHKQLNQILLRGIEITALM